MKRYFEFVDAKSSKFWEVWLEGQWLYTRFGKIGANGQTTLKQFSASEDAEKAMHKAVGEKLRKGYTEGGGAPREVQPVSKLGKSSGQMGATSLIKTLENIWVDDSALDEFEPDETIFDGFTTADWIDLAGYMHTKTSYPYAARTWDQFEAQGSIDQHFDLEVYELLSEAGWNYFQSRFQEDVSSEAIACLGFLGNMTAHFPFHGTHFDLTKVENLQKEITHLGVLFAPKKFAKAKVMSALKTCADGLPLLSDQGLSLLVPYMTGSILSRELQKLLIPQVGMFSYTMSSLMCVLNDEISTPHYGDLLISPRIIHFLMDDNNIIQPWWTEFYLWQDCAEEWKSSKLSFEPQEGHQAILATLLENALDIRRYPDRETAKRMLHDEEMFVSLLSFLKG